MFTVCTICDWICKNWSYCPWQEVQFFGTDTKIHQYTIKFHYKNEAALSGLVLLAAFSQPTGDLYEWSWSLMEFWWTSRGLCMTVQLRGAGWRLLLSLNNHFGKFSANNLFYFSHSFAHHPARHHSPIVELPGITIPVPTVVKKLSKMAGNFILDTWIGDGFKSKELLQNVWKIHTHNPSHWWSSYSILNNSNRLFSILVYRL